MQNKSKKLHNILVIGGAGTVTTFAQNAIQSATAIQREQPVVLFEPCNLSSPIDFAFPNVLAYTKDDYLKRSKHNNRKKKKRKNKCN